MTLLKCPYCNHTSEKPQGIASHIRFNHPEKLEAWKKFPHERKFVQAPEGFISKIESEVEAPRPEDYIRQIVGAVESQDGSEIRPDQPPVEKELVPTQLVMRATLDALRARREQVASELEKLHLLEDEANDIDRIIKLLENDETPLEGDITKFQARMKSASDSRPQ